MEIVMQESVKIPCSVVVSGLTETTSDDDVSTYLQKYVYNVCNKYAIYA